MPLLWVAAILGELGQLNDVAVGIEQQGVGREAVAAGASDFLIESLHVFGRVVMDDESDVGFVDAHAEGDGGADDLGAVVDEVLLNSCAFIGGHAGVVGVCHDVPFAEFVGNSFGRLAGKAVYNSAFTLSFFYKVCDFVQLTQFFIVKTNV